MPSPEFEKSPESTSVVCCANLTTQTTPAVAAANGIETEDLLLEIPKIDQELAEKLSAGKTSVDKLTTMAAAPPVKRGSKKKVTEPASLDKEIVEPPAKPKEVKPEKNEGEAESSRGAGCNGA
ncbi:hypothetical protein quinque_013696 [Culex quinquefasciatus]